MFVFLRAGAYIFSFHGINLKNYCKTLHVSQIQLTNATDTAFMNMTYKNMGLVLPKLVTDIVQFITTSLWIQKSVHHHKYIQNLREKTMMSHLDELSNKGRLKENILT